MADPLQDLLRRLTGDPNAVFREDQRQAVEDLAEHGKRVLCVQRTGWGKSAVYFLATSLLRQRGAGPTILVSPLIALMSNQVLAAKRLGIAAQTINSANIEQWPKIFAAIERDEVDILLISPERLANAEFQATHLAELLSRCGLLVVDEAHCISDWGHDFRAGLPAHRSDRRRAFG